MALAGWAGGVLAVTAGILVSRSADPERGLTLLAAGLLWMVASAATGNRTLFCPFACWLAAGVFVCNCTAAYWRASALSALIMVLFFAIRIHQGANGRVLWMEIVAAVTVAGLVVVAEGLLPRFAFRGWIVAILASLVAGLSVIL